MPATQRALANAQAAVGIQLLDPLLIRGQEKMPEILRWFVEQMSPTGQKRSGQGINPGSAKGPATLVAGSDDAQPAAERKPESPRKKKERPGA
jgi:hypothetical protein